MSVYLNDPDVTLYHGDALEVLRSLPDGSVDCVVTSPPYWGLRDYGNEGQLGLEPTPDLFVQNMVAVFREVRRVLADHGTCWVNLGDSYATSGGNDRNGSSDGGVGRGDRPDERLRAGLKPKDLVGIPWRVAFALQADGWYLRSDIIWAKPNPMPESVTDRPTKSHEYVFLLAKGEWKSRVIPFTNLPSEFLHLRNDLGPEHPYLWANELCVRLATAILDLPEGEQNLCLSAFDPQVGQESLRSAVRDLVGGVPVEHRTAVLASRFLAADCAAKEFLCELDGLGVALADGNHLEVVGSPSFALPPSVYAYGKTAVAIHHPGEVRKLDFSAHAIDHSRPSRCAYWFDAEAVREPNDTTAKRPNYTAIVDNRTSEKYGAGMESRRERHGDNGYINPAGRNVRSVWQIDYTEDEEVEWIGKAGFCLVCGGLRIAGNGSAVTTAQATDASSVSTESAAHTESPTNTSSGQSPKDTPSTTSARTRDASTPPTSNQWSAESTSSEAPTPSQPKTQPRPIASTDTSSPPRTPTADPTVAGNVVRVCDCGCEDGERPNAPDVWRIATQPYPEAHFATFPEELARRCIVAGCPLRVCRVCGKPSERIVEKELVDVWHRNKRPTKAALDTAAQDAGDQASRRARDGHVSGHAIQATTLGWSDCGHNNWRPGLVLDPFIGSGTVAKVARDHQRHAIGIDLNETYLELAARRLQQLSLLAET